MLKDSLPRFVSEMKELADLLNTSQIEIDRIISNIEDMVSQFYVASATYSLDDWEKEFGIEKNSMLTDVQRRAQILAKLNTRTPASIKMLENLVKQTLNADFVQIVEIPTEYRFIVYVQSKYLVENMNIADDAIKKARPAHLGYSFINSLIRQNNKRMYVAVVGRTVKTIEGEVTWNTF